MSTINNSKFKIEGMHCNSCALEIDFDLEDLNGVQSAQTNYIKQFVDVKYDAEKVNIEDIISQIKKTGYNAKLID